MWYNTNMRIFIAIIFLVSCGKPKKDCMSQMEAIARCDADAIHKYFPADLPEFEKVICRQKYPVQGCY